MFTFGSSFVYTEREGIKGGGLQATFQWNWMFVPNLLMFVRNKKMMLFLVLAEVSGSQCLSSPIRCD